MGQRLALVLVCVTAMFVPVGADQKPSNLVSSALEFFEGHNDVSIDEFLGRLRPPPIDAVERARIVAALPPHGDIPPDARALAKMSLAKDVLAYHGRRGLISFTIIDVDPAFVGLHARAVILASAHALSLVNNEEFAAIVAHEVGHEYVWTDYTRAAARQDHGRIRELELRCDGIAVLTLRRLGLNPNRLITAFDMLTRYNEQRLFDADWRDYPSRDELRAFVHAVAKLQWTSPLPAVKKSTLQTPATVLPSSLGSTVEANGATAVDARSDTVIDCGPPLRPGLENCVRTIRRVLTLLPRHPEKIQVLDPNRATPDLKARLQHVDGFAVPGGRVVYLNERGEVLEHALRRAGVWDCVLATVVWHEMAHIDGAQEPEAQRREEQLWLQFSLGQSRWRPGTGLLKSEVRALGAAVGSTRTPEQSQIALFWADGAGTETPPGHWNRIARDIAAALGNTLEENARLFALLNIAMADAAICAWDAKYTYDFWRPETAIRATGALAWNSFFVTPPFPDYISGHSTFSAAAATVLGMFYGTDNIAFSTGSDFLPGAIREFSGFSAAAAEAAVSRLYGGVHFRSAMEDGLAAGIAIGEWTFAHYLRPTGNRGRA
jgi:membrane-associated phospholipid phosphatase